MISRIARPVPRTARCDTIVGGFPPRRSRWNSLGETSVCNRFCQTWVEGCGRCVRSERPAQAKRCAGFKGHFDKIGGEDIDRHPIASRGPACRGPACVDTCLAIACDGRFEAGYSEDLALKADLNGRVNHCVAVDHESTRHLSTSPRRQPSGARRGNFEATDSSRLGAIRAEIGRCVCTLECIADRGSPMPFSRIFDWTKSSVPRRAAPQAARKKIARKRTAHRIRRPLIEVACKTGSDGYGQGCR
jgi:hypothetical protein